MKIRVISICLIQKDDEIFVLEGYDTVKGETFYRPLGGGIEFGETAKEAAIREIQEEMGTEIINVVYVTTFENIFTFNGKPGHEIVQVMSGSFKDESLYLSRQIECNDNGVPFIGKWMNITDFINGMKILYPDGLAEYLSGANKCNHTDLPRRWRSGKGG